MEKFVHDVIERRRHLIKETKRLAEKFIVSGGCCPFCGEKNVQEDDLWDRDFFILTSFVRCPRCLKTWRAIYQLSEILTEELSDEEDELYKELTEGDEEDDDQLGTQTPNR